MERRTSEEPDPFLAKCYEIMTARRHERNVTLVMVVTGWIVSLAAAAILGHIV